ncbi:unnamed protein product [Closterium sp. Yama58-4]|nr:unnamed protein product [Closterium sp. Yama58-4]
MWPRGSISAQWNKYTDNLPLPLVAAAMATASLSAQSASRLSFSSSALTGCCSQLKAVSLAAAKPQFSENGRLAVRCAGKGGFIPAEHRWMYEGIENKGPDEWNRTYYPKEADHLNVEKQWYIVDAADKRLGRLASTIANHIRGKDQPTYTPSVDMGAYVIVVNAEKVAVTGKKRAQKIYRRHSGRPGGMTEETFDQVQARIPERIVEHAVRGMLPKGRLGRRLFTHLKVYKGESHPHEAQMPQPLPIHDKPVARNAESGSGGDGGETSGGEGRWKSGEEEQWNEARDVQNLAQLSRYTEALEERRGRNQSDEAVTRALEAEARQWRQRTYQHRGFLYEFSAYRVSPSRFVVLAISGLNFTWVADGEGCRWVGRDGSRVNGSVWYRDFMGPKTQTDSLAAFCQLWGNTSQAGGYLVMTMDGVEAVVYNERPGQPLEPPPDDSVPVHLTWCSQPLYGTIDAGVVWAWAEYHRVHANVSRFLFYDMAAWTPALTALFTPYFAAGIAAVTDMSAGLRFGFRAGVDLKFFTTKHQTLASNDCIYRSLFTSRWVTLHDTDEFLVPVPPHSLSSLLAAHAHAPWLSHGAFAVDPSICQGEREGEDAPAPAAAAEGAETQWDEAAVAEAKRRAVQLLSRTVFRQPEVWCVREGQQIDGDLCEDWRGHRKLVVNPRKTEVMSIHIAREPQTGGVVLNAATELRHFHLSGVVNPVNAHCQTIVPPGESHVWFVRDTAVADKLQLLVNSSAPQPEP